MTKLFYSPGACSMAVHVALNECNLPVELINTNLSEGKQRDPAFLKINPRGQVPVLQDGDLVIREGAAQMLYVLDKEKNALMPQSGAARAKALEWLMWGNATLHPTYSRFFWLNRAVQDEAQKKALCQATLEQIQKLWDEAEAHLGSNKFLAGDQPTIGDILMTVIANWNGWLPTPIKFGPNITRVLKAISSRPAYQKALQAEGVEYKAAA